MAVRLTLLPRFERAYKKLTPNQKDAVDKALTRFLDNPRHPSLHFEKLRGSRYRTIRADLGMRIILRGGQDDHFDLVDVGSHNLADRYG